MLFSIIYLNLLLHWPLYTFKFVFIKGRQLCIDWGGGGGIPRSCQADSVEKYVLMFLIGQSCPLQINPCVNLYSGSSVSAAAGNTTGADFLGFCVG